MAADAAVRDMDGDAREQMALNIDKLRPTLAQHPYRWFSLGGDEPLMVWLQRTGYVDIAGVHKVKAEVAAVAMGAQRCKVLMIDVNSDGTFNGGWARDVLAPAVTDARYSQRLQEAAAMKERSVELPTGAERRAKGLGR